MRRNPAAPAAAASAAGKSVGVVFGAVLCLGLLLLVIAGTVVLSLISIYTPNHGVQTYGDEYRLNSLVLRSTFDNTTYSFNNSTVADSTAYSTACSSTYTNAGQSNVAGCVVQNNVAYGPVNPSGRRRRRAPSVWLYTIGQARIFYSTPCTSSADKGKYSSNASSTCVAKRLAACNLVFGNLQSTYTQWTLTSGTTLSVVDTTFSNYIKLAVTQIFGVPSSTALSIASQNNLGLSANTTSQINAGCQYIGPISQAAIAAAIAAQSTLSTTQPSSTIAGG